MLIDQIGVSRYRLYSEFGNMRGLFEAALGRYNDEILDLRFGPLEHTETVLSEVLSVLDFYGPAGNGPTAGRGCLLCNTAVEFGPNDPAGSGATQRYFERLPRAFRNALGNAQKTGQLAGVVDTVREADLLTSVVLGVFVIIRAKAPSGIIEHAATSAKEHIETLATWPKPPETKEKSAHSGHLLLNTKAESYCCSEAQLGIPFPKR
ncbi:MAG: hypothetical protein HKN63_06535 [Rhodobacteraceae bacterium]|nr:hypothetical protein [Paracoccaceae bacterium]